MGRLSASFAVIVFAFQFVWATSAEAYSFAGLGVPEGVFPTVGQEWAIGFALSADGSTVVGEGGGSIPTAFRWDAQTGYENFGRILDHAITRSVGVSGDGSKIVGTEFLGLTTPPQFHSTVWTRESGFQRFNLPVGSGEDVYERVSAAAISADGTTIVGGARMNTTDSTSMAFRMNASGQVDFLQAPIGASAGAADVSGNGSVVVGNVDLRAAIWVGDDAPLILGFVDHGVDTSSARRVSGDGQVVVGFSRTSIFSQAFRWDAQSGVEQLGFLPGDNLSFANGVSDDGSIVVGTSLDISGESPSSAVLWTAELGLIELAVLLQANGIDLTGWTLANLHDISADGRVILGDGINPSGRRESFLAVIPEPSVATLLGAGLVALAFAGTDRRAAGVSRKGCG